MATKREELEKGARGEGCLGRAASDEPIFILRAQDKVAAMAVTFWADVAEALGAPKGKVLEARALADKMRAWSTRRIPD